jgi:uncharacterized membrane protein
MRTLAVLIFSSLICFGSNCFGQEVKNLHMFKKTKDELFLYKSSSKNAIFPDLSFHQDSTDECDINLDNAIYLKDVRIIDAGDSLFTITKKEIDRKFEISQLKSIKFINHGFSKGLIYGVLGSTAFWGVLVLANRGGPVGFLIGFALGLPTGLITGAITEFATQDDLYEFGNTNTSTKAKRLKYIIQKHK